MTRPRAEPKDPIAVVDGRVEGQFVDCIFNRRHRAVSEALSKDMLDTFFHSLLQVEEPGFHLAMIQMRLDRLEEFDFFALLAADVRNFFLFHIFLPILLLC